MMLDELGETRGPCITVRVFNTVSTEQILVVRDSADRDTTSPT